MTHHWVGKHQHLLAHDPDAWWRGSLQGCPPALTTWFMLRVPGLRCPTHCAAQEQSWMDAGHEESPAGDLAVARAPRANEARPRRHN